MRSPLFAATIPRKICVIFDAISVFFWPFWHVTGGIVVCAASPKVSLTKNDPKASLTKNDKCPFGLPLFVAKTNPCSVAASCINPPVKHPACVDNYCGGLHHYYVDDEGSRIDATQCKYAVGQMNCISRTKLLPATRLLEVVSDLSGVLEWVVFITTSWAVINNHSLPYPHTPMCRISVSGVAIASYNSRARHQSSD